jgi:alpha-L-rhamnosidase
MVYYRFKSILGFLYGDKSLLDEASTLKEVIRKESRHGIFFCDNSIKTEDGGYALSEICTETCQYYAFFTGVTDVETDKALWETMVSAFGAKRKKTGAYPEIHFSNAFIGNYLRCELLLKNGLTEKLDADIRGYFLGMANRTGTLWEHDSTYASCNHGFASHVLVWLNALGYLAD